MGCGCICGCWCIVRGCGRGRGTSFRACGSRVSACWWSELLYIVM